jgi:hypothetical protein
MATEHTTGDAAPIPTTPEALMADRQLFWGLFCRVAFWAVITVAVVLVLLVWAVL